MPGRRLAFPGLQLAGSSLREIRRPLSSSCPRCLPLRASPAAVRRSASPKSHPVLPSRHLSSLKSPLTPAPAPSPSSSWSKSAYLAAGLPLVSSTEVTTNPLISTLSDILLSSPIPSYGLTIVLTTFMLRSALTLPVTLWQRRRAALAMKQIGPDLKAYNSKVAQELVPKARRKGYNMAQYQAEVVKKVSAFRESELAKYGLSGWRMRVTQVLPTLVNVIILVTFSSVIRNTLHLPSVGVGSESFLWLEKLADPDQGLAILGGAFAVLSAEVTSYTGKKVDEQRGLAEEQRVLRMEEMARKEEEFKEELKRRKEEERERAEAERIQASKPRRVAAAPTRIRPVSSATPASSSAKRSLSTAPTPGPSVNPPNSSPAKRKMEPVAEMQDAEVDSGSRMKDRALSMFMGGLQRFSGFALAVFGGYTPSGVVLYWTCSTFFSLCQNIYLSRRQYKGSIPSLAKVTTPAATPGKT